MQGSHLEKLFFAISLIDKVTEPSKQVAKSISKLQGNFKSAVMDIATGGASLFLVGSSFEKFSRDTREMDKALGEVESLGVSTKELKALEKTSISFTNKFGGNAIDIARSAYDIQSAIPGLADGALAAFTKSSALLGKATKSQSDVMTKYMGTMYNIFEHDAKKMGQANWVEAMTGKTAEAVKIFKTTGSEMSSAFSSLGSTGQISGVSMDEQMAVLGALQGAMGSGANAGTAYKGFLSKLDAGQNTLGLSFKGADGELLPVYEIMERIKNSVSNLDKDQQVAKLTKAFGETGASAVMNLMNKTHQLKGNIESLSKINNASGAEVMAQSMVDELELFESAWKNIKIALGKGVLPLLNGVLGCLIPIFAFTSELVATSTTLQVIVGLIAGLIGSVGILFGITKLWIGLTTMFTTIKLAIDLIKASTIMQTVATKIAAGAQWLWNVAIKQGAVGILLQLGSIIKLTSVMFAQSIALKAATVAQWAMNAGLYAAKIAVWLFSAALWACPLTWVVAAIVAVIAVIVLCVVYWEDITNAVINAWAWFNTLLDDLGIFGDVLLYLLGPIGAIIFAFREWDTIKYIVGNVLDWVLDKWDSTIVAISDAWSWFNTLLDDLGIFGDILLYLLGPIGAIIFAFREWETIKNIVGSVLEWVLDKWDSTIGVIGEAWNWLFGDDKKEFAVTKNIKQSSENAIIPEAVQHRKKQQANDVIAGGINSSNITNNSTNFGGVNIYNSGGMTPGQLEEWALMQG